MTTGKSYELIWLGSDSTFQFKLDLAETYSAETNKSVLKVLSAYICSSRYSGVAYYLDGILKVAGAELVSFSSMLGTYSVYVDEKDTWYPIQANGVDVTAEIEIEHDVDGGKTVAVEMAANNYSKCMFVTLSGGSGSGWKISGAQTIELTRIPYPSTIGATDANIGAVSMIAVTRKSDVYTHSIAYQFGAEAGYVNSDGSVSASEVKITAASVAFMLPASFYAQIPNAKSGKCTLTCRTYYGDSQIGDAQTASFVATAEESACRPIVSGAVEDSNSATISLTGNAGRLVRFKSNALCTIEANARNGASIANKTIAGKPVTGNTLAISGIEATSVAFAAVDSRGYSNAVSVLVDLVPYVLLTVNPAVTRVTSTGSDATLTITGNYYNGGFGAVNNSLEIKYRVAPSGGGYGAYQTVNPSLSGNAYTAQTALSGLSYDADYVVEITVTDKLETLTKAILLGRGRPSHYWNKRKFALNVPLILSTKSYGSTLPEGFQEGQTFFLKNPDGTYSLKIFDGTSWN